MLTPDELRLVQRVRIFLAWAQEHPDAEHIEVMLASRYTWHVREVLEILDRVVGKLTLMEQAQATYDPDKEASEATAD